VAARPGVGKTAFLFALAYRQIVRGVKTFYCNLEMPVEQMWNRLGCLHSHDFTLRDLTESELTDRQIPRIANLSRELVNFSPLFFESMDLGAPVKASKETIQPSSESVLLIDYVGLFTMRGLGSQERYWLISECAKQLKLLARHLDIPIVAAVQLNRAIESRKEKTSTLADLRDSGELENHADTVFALTREDKERLEVDVLKNRHGPLVSYSLAFDGPRAAVEEIG
jgi:replicative DNA helicase